MGYISKYSTESNFRKHNQHGGFSRNVHSIFNCDTSSMLTRKTMSYRTIQPLVVFTLLQFLLSFAHGQGPGSPNYENVNFEVEEERPSGTFVGQIPARNGNKYKFSSDPEYFSINENTGEIATAVVIDRDALQSDVFTLAVTSFPNSNHIVEVQIQILDINDNNPTFGTFRTSVSFSENDAPGTPIILATATDKDTGRNDVTGDYSIISGNEESKFDLILWQDTSKPLLQLINKVKLDREDQDFYTLNISVRDGGVISKYGYLQVDITIRDSNDNHPLFEQSEYTVTVNETVDISTSIIQVVASDQDVGDNADITYSIIGDQEQFWIDYKTGEVTTRKKLDCPQECGGDTDGECKTRSCIFTVEARDNGQPLPLTGRAYITVTLIDENDHDPSITFTPNVGKVDEGAQVNDQVVLVKVSDQDDGANGNVSLGIVKGNERGHFSLERIISTHYLIKVAATLDRERINKYNLTIQAKDNGNPIRSAIAYFVIYVNDINDHAPKFVQSSYSAELSELVPISSYVAGVTALDNDTGVNAMITYSLTSGNELGWFQINPETGLITTRTSLDKEQKSFFILTVKAIDGGATPYSSTVNISILIWDENDEVPRFGEDSYTTDITENDPPGPLPISTTAIDHDQGKNGTITYSFHTSVEILYPGIFQVNANTGTISTLQRIDREMYPSFNVILKASDQGEPPLMSSTEVVIYVEDENDNSPVFYPLKYHAQILENQPAAMRVVQVLATDKDTGINGKISYAINSGSNFNFDIDSTTGVLTTTRSLAKGKYTLTMKASDERGRQSNTMASVDVFVISLLDNLPLFSNPGGYSFSVVENRNLGIFVGQVTANGPQQLAYTIVSGDPDKDFNINGNNGNINTLKSLDREITARYTLTVVASSPSSFVSTEVTITILDLNDNSPVFNLLETLVYVHEDSPIGKDRFLARADDTDFEENSTLSYSFKSGASDNFVIDSSTGLISVAKPLEYVFPSDNEVIVTVLAEDAGSPQRTSSVDVTFVVKDVNDHSPVFNATNYVLGLEENLSVNSHFFQLEAVDLDGGSNGKVTYEIVSGNDDGHFGVFPNGVLYIAKQLDRETKDVYTLRMKSSDFGEVTRYSLTNVTIHVLDANDNDPLFTNETFYFGLLENSGIGVSVGRVYASDDDLGKNRELFYSIDGDHQGFDLDSQTGIITSTKSFDREALISERGTSEITLSVMVRDSGEIQRFSKATVSVTIGDMNDMIPEFSKRMYEKSVAENQQVNAEVITVMATDEDINANAEIKYRIISGDENEMFSVDEDTGVITLNKDLDRESKDLYHLTVMASDSGIPILTTQAIVRIKILDSNDNSPIFSDGPRDFNLSELTPLRYHIATFSATDDDLGNDGLISYSITRGNIGSTFNLDSRTGKLNLAEPLDYDVKTRIFDMDITASDNGQPVRESSIRITINVYDENDYVPSFTSDNILKEITENVVIGYSVLTVTAEDLDSGVNGEVSYSIVKQVPNGNFFSIEGETGLIKTAAEIDREFSSVFSITVRATDMAMPISSRLHSDKLVRIIVQDENDNDPVFVSQKAASVLVTAQANTVITRINATDADADDNAQVEYTIHNSGSSGSDVFSLELKTGNLYLRSPLRSDVLSYDLTVLARDKGDPQRSQFHSMKIFARLNNENGPDFTESAYSASIYENMPQGTSIITVSASYPQGSDSSNGGIEYYITRVTADNKNMPKFFDIKNPKIGTVTTTQPLDREFGYDRYNVEITAVDTEATQPKTRSINVQVTILDENDSPPVFTMDGRSDIYVAEDKDPRNIITKVTATDPDTEGSLSFEMIDGDDGKFSIDPANGDVYIESELDRETKSEYVITVEADDGVQTSQTTLVIKITDVNDEAPEFTEPAYYFDIPENTETAVTVGEILAIDHDEENNAQVTYKIQSHWGSEKFSLHPHTGEFTLIGNLDYEEVNQYVLTIKAQDSGPNPKSGTVTVYMNVIDENDNSPLFDPSSYSIQVSENTTINSSLMQVTATDIDSAANSQIKYSIIGGDSLGAFDLDQYTGTLNMAGQLDRETEGFYNLVVEAVDQTPQPGTRLSSTALISVTVKDVNDNAPVFEMPSTITIRENSRSDIPIYTIVASDYDQGDNGVVEYSLVNSASNLFTIGRVDGILKLNGNLDREVNDNYNITVKATDKGSPESSSTFHLQIKVGDDNDHSPVFSPKIYTKTLREDAPIGTSLFTLQATDADIEKNAELRFEIISGDETRSFYLDSHTGVFSIHTRLDYESKKIYDIRVMIYDLGEPQKSDTASVVITLEDVNDCQPIFINVPYTVQAQENIAESELPVYITQIEATDCDSEWRGKVGYTITEGGEDIFAVNSQTGVITASERLDREMIDSYELTITATDSGSPRQSSSVIVLVQVSDDNDHTPTFEHAQYRGIVMENVQAPAHIATVTAVDLDSGENGHVRYSLIDDGSEQFTIDANSGEITTMSELDREMASSYSLIVMARDNALLRRSSTVEVVVTVEDENDNSPVFLKQSYNVFIRDTTGANTFVTGVMAVDKDSGINSVIEYSLTGSSDITYFSIDSRTGVIKASKPLRSSEKSSFEFTVSATDKQTTPDTVTIRVEFLSSSTLQFPIISIPNPNLQLVETRSIETAITTATATSSKPGASLSYHIAGGNTANTFQINQRTGEITLRHGLDYETVTDYNLWIEGRDDSSNPPLSNYVELNVVVSDSNDSPPVFDKLYYNVTVDENENPPVSVISVTASDADSGDNGRISYHLVEAGSDSSSSHFAIDAAGDVRTMARLDREHKDRYMLVVTATDNGNPRNTATATIDVKVNDRNDVLPTFTRHFNSLVPENAPIGTSILQVTTTDGDFGENAVSTYRFVDQVNTFAIHHETGWVTLTGKLDREMKANQYLLKVRASDGSHSITTSITIDVLDINDNPPQFFETEYVFDIADGSTSGSLVGAVAADDIDGSGLNSQVWYRMKYPQGTFRIDAETGDITTLIDLTYMDSLSSVENVFMFYVSACDRGDPVLKKDVKVTVRVAPANEYKPEFEFPEYSIPVAENSPLQLSVGAVNASDEDVGENGRLSYSKMSGNGTDYFDVEASTGELRVIASLSNLRTRWYVLNIKAEDHGTPSKSSTVTVTFKVIEENLYIPVFQNSMFSASVSEDQQFGFGVIDVSASDNDQGLNGQIGYYITSGDDDHHFKIDVNDGVITVNKALDYETVSVYKLTVTARDRGPMPKQTSRIFTVSVNDVNDYPPTFAESSYDAYVFENLQSGASVYTAHAIDLDTPSNGVEYYITGNQLAISYFRIAKLSGLIRTKLKLDYESRTDYSVVVKALNPGTQLSGSTTINVHVVGVNEFKPVFTQALYNLDVQESASTLTSIGSVTATDEDEGMEGIVEYYLIGDSNLQGFTVDTYSGAIIVAANIDREATSEILLSVMAKNNGPIRGNMMDWCDVRIRVGDANDPPKFTQSLYEKHIFENAQDSSSVIQVTANDNDLNNDNSQFYYTILSGNVRNAFKIGPDTGLIAVNAALDRETLAEYSLIVAATDAGTPPKTGTATVKVYLDDINDNGPYFNPEIPVGNITENKAARMEVAINLNDVTFDRDIEDRNQVYRYVLLDNRDRFEVGETSGRVQAKVPLDREAQEKYLLSLSVTDNGVPVMTSTLMLKVQITDVNDNPSYAREMQVKVYTYLGEIASGPIASVHPLDEDITGDYECEIGTASPPFQIPSTCDLYPVNNINMGVPYALQITGSDGIHSAVSYTANVDFKEFNKDMIDNSIVMRIEDKEASRFLSESYTVFLSALNNILSGQSSVELYSMKQVFDNDLDLFIASKQSVLSRNALIQLIETNKAEIENQASIIIKHVNYNPCLDSPCKNGGECSAQIQMDETFRIYETDAFVFTSTAVEQHYDCSCTDEFTGETCEEPKNKCQQNPCQNQGTCSLESNGDFRCDCTSGWEGDTCAEDVNECIVANPCQKGGTCSNSEGSYRCSCLASYTGRNCDTEVRSCSLRPCKNDGVCQDIDDGYRCRCKYGYRGQNCEIVGIGFEDQSYMQYTTPLDDYSNTLNIEFATVKTNAMLLLYSSESTYEFLALEIVNRRVRLSYSLGNAEVDGTSGLDGELVQVTSPVAVSDGQWYSIVATRENKAGSVKVSLCEENQPQCGVCLDGDSSCHAQATGGTYRVLDATDSVLLLGGVNDFNIINNIPVSSHDFAGCMRSVEVDGLDLLQLTARYSNGTSETCPRLSVDGVCGTADGDSAVCDVEAECVDEWNGFSCRCPDGMTGATCSNEVTSLSFGPNAVVEYSVKPSYKRDLLLASKTSSRKRRQISNAYSFSLTFKTFEQSGLILQATMNNGDEFITLFLSGGVLKCRTESFTLNGQTDVSDGEWYNVTLVHTGSDLTMMVNNGGAMTGAAGVIPNGLWDSFSLANTEHPEMEGFKACVDKFLVNGESLPYDGYSDKYEIKSSGEVTSECTAYLLYAGKDGPPTQIVIIVICTLFAVILIGVLLVFVFIIYRRKIKDKKQPPFQNGNAVFDKINGSISSKTKINNDSGRSHPDSGIAEEDNNFNISEHIQNELNNGVAFDEREIRGSLHSNRPDIVVPDVIGDRNPEESEDDGFDNTGYSDGPPEHYDFDNASSIAPSDLLDYTQHYRRYRLGQVPSHNNKYKGGHKHLHHQRGTPSPSAMLAARQSPASVSVQMGRQSPADILVGRTTPQPKSQLTVENVNQLNRQTPVNQLSRASPAPNIPVVGRDRMTSPLAAGPTSMRSTPLSGLSGLFPSNISQSTSYTESIPNGHAGGRGSRPNSKLKQPINQVGLSRNTPTKGLTIEEVNRLNARHTPPTTLDAISSSSEEDINKNNINQTDFTHSDLLEPSNSMLPPESSSEEETNDSFTCSEFEDDHKIRNDRHHPRGVGVGNNFSRLPRVNENEDTDTTMSRGGGVGRHIDSDSNRESHSTFFTASEDDFPRKISKAKLPNGALSVDYMLNWGTNYEKLIGVFQDIAQLSQPNTPSNTKKSPQQNSRPTSRTSNTSPKPYLPPKPSRVASPGMRVTGPGAQQQQQGQGASSLPRHMVRSPLPPSPLVPNHSRSGSGGLVPNGHMKQSSIASIASSSHDRQSSISSVHSSRSGGGGHHRPTSSLSHHLHNGNNHHHHHHNNHLHQHQPSLTNHSRSSSTLSNSQNNSIPPLNPHHSPSSSTLSNNMSYMSQPPPPMPNHSRSSSKSSLSSRPSSNHNSMYNPLNPQPPPPPPAMQAAAALQRAAAAGEINGMVNGHQSPQMLHKPPAREEYV